MPNNLVLPSNTSKNGSRSTSKTSRPARNGSTTSIPSLSFPAALATLTFGKASRVFSAFISFHYLQDKVALPLYLFFVTLGASLCLNLLQRPWSGKRIGQKRARRIVIAGIILAATLYIWTAGLRSAGPLRTLLVDGAELPLLYVFAVVSRRELPEKRKTRGAICMLLAYVLLIWDASGHAPDVRELEQTKLGQKAENAFGKITRGRQVGVLGNMKVEQVDDGDVMHQDGDAIVNERGGRRRLLTTYNPPVKGSGSVRDAFVEGTALRSEIGVVLVLIASVMMQSSRAFTRRLATELGGAKRHFALSTTMACIWLMPLACLSWISNWSGAVLSLSVIGGITRIELGWIHLMGFLSVGFLWLVLPYYVRAIVSTALPQRTMMQWGVVGPFLMAGGVCVVWGEGVSWILAAAFVLECVGVQWMMAGGVKRSLSELPIDASERGSSGGATVGME